MYLFVIHIILSNTCVPFNFLASLLPPHPPRNSNGSKLHNYISIIPINNQYNLSKNNKYPRLNNNFYLFFSLKQNYLRCFRIRLPFDFANSQGTLFLLL